MVGETWHQWRVLAGTSLWLIDTNLWLLVAAVWHSEIKTIPVRAEEAGSRSGGGGELCNSLIFVR